MPPPASVLVARRAAEAAAERRAAEAAFDRAESPVRTPGPRAIRSFTYSNFADPHTDRADRPVTASARSTTSRAKFSSDALDAAGETTRWRGMTKYKTDSGAISAESSRRASELKPGETRSTSPELSVHRGFKSSSDLKGANKRKCSFTRSLGEKQKPEVDADDVLRKRLEASTKLEARISASDGDTYIVPVPPSEARSKRSRYEYKKRPWFVLDPRSSRFIPIWDAVTAFALIFTIIVTPYEVGFVPGEYSSAVDTLFVLNRIVDSIFFVDMMLQFVIMYQEGGKFGGQAMMCAPKSRLFDDLDSRPARCSRPTLKEPSLSDATAEKMCSQGLWRALGRRATADSSPLSAGNSSPRVPRG